MSPAMDLIKRTGQASKLWTGCVLMLLSAGMLLVSGYYLGVLDPVDFFIISIFAIAVGIFGFAYLCFAIRCPDCGARWIWLMASNRVGDPKHWSFRNGSCNMCDTSDRQCAE